MIILPAIDIKNGQCVRLIQGDFATTEKVAEDWLNTAMSFQQDGAEWIHMVDLDGALSGSLQNSDIFVEVSKKTGLKVELGGGIRTLKSIAYYIENGISRVVLGSIAITDPQMVAEAVKVYGDKIAIGIDARDGMVKSSGWLVDSKVNYIEMAKQMEALGVETIIFTDITKDGTLQGPNLEQLFHINEAVSTRIIASGGMHNLKDIQTLLEMGLYGAICGKALYQGTLSLKEAIECCKKER